MSLLLTAYLRIPVGAIASNFFPDVPTAYVDLITAIIIFPAALAVLHVVSRSAIERIHVQGVTKEIDAVLGAVLGGVEAILHPVGPGRLRRRLSQQRLDPGRRDPGRGPIKEIVREEIARDRPDRDPEVGGQQQGHDGKQDPEQPLQEPGPEPREDEPGDEPEQDDVHGTYRPRC